MSRISHESKAKLRCKVAIPYHMHNRKYKGMPTASYICFYAISLVKTTQFSKFAKL